jgi:serine/threonine protein kinase
MSNIPDDTTLSQSAVRASFTSIGPYRLIQMLGVGGMGEVWRAEQTEPLHRIVALKLIKAWMDTNAVVARFDSERQALALMEHPNIAKVLDAGATPSGRPYFVMEFVHGLAITDYCDKHRFTIKERLALFIQVCEGVQHAHQKAIIHRDLKPSNILVEEVDNKPVPKIIDFGLAKAMGQRLTEMTMFTEAGAVLGTPDYMSPDQADRHERNIDTRTDDRNARPDQRERERRAGDSRAQQAGHYGDGLHAADRRRCAADARCHLRRADGGAERGSGVLNFQKFGTLWYGGDFSMAVSDCHSRLGRLTQR